MVGEVVVVVGERTVIKEEEDGGSQDLGGVKAGEDPGFPAGLEALEVKGFLDLVVMGLRPMKTI